MSPKNDINPATMVSKNVYDNHTDPWEYKSKDDCIKDDNFIAKSFAVSPGVMWDA